MYYRQHHIGKCVSTLLLVGACFQCAVVFAAEESATHGLIVRLKDPVPHESTVLRAASPRQKKLVIEATERESSRWRRVITESGLGGESGRREPRMRPVGRDQQLLEFERPLSRSEAAKMREKLMSRPEVDWVESNTRERRQQTPPSDPLFSQQWWLHPVGGGNANAIGARLRGVAGFQSAWLSATHAQVAVAVIDSGLTSPIHEDLAGRTLSGYDFVSESAYSNDGDGRDADPSDPGDFVTTADLTNPAFSGCSVESSSWHGTIVSGIVAAQANNPLGGAGIHWGAKILPVRVAGKCGAALQDIIDGMRWAAGLAVFSGDGSQIPTPSMPARVLNISFGGNPICGPAYQAAIDELSAQGVIVVAAAGNGWSRPTRPASCSGVVGVVGLNRDGFKTNYSNFGGNIGISGIAAVAGDDNKGEWGPALGDSGILTLTNSGSTVPEADAYRALFGTSFAAPQVSATIAHMLSVNAALTYSDILEGLRLSARPHVTSPKIAACSDANPGRCICTTATCGFGILDAEQALLYASLGSGYVPPVRLPEVVDNADVDRALALAVQDRASNVAPVGGSGGGDVSSEGVATSGGGAFGVFWLMALATAAGTLRLLRPRPQRGQG